MSPNGVLRKILQLTVPAVLAACVTAGPASASPSSPDPAAGSSAPGAAVSVVKGKPTRIADWPWQVAVAFRPGAVPGKQTPTRRFYCGGSLIAPKLVITAGHCVSFLPHPKAGKIEVISGRTWLNSSAGQVTAVKAVLMPRNRRTGKLLYHERGGSATWDLALLSLARSVSAPTIKLAGPDEISAWKPGHLAWATGWGTTVGGSSKASPGLRVTRQVMLPARACHGADGSEFVARLMNCSGAPEARASTCSGDSGGPLTARITGGYRLVGVTSWGDGICRGNQPSVLTRVAGEPIRRWVAATALRLTGSSVVGSGGVAPPAPSWCRVPRVLGLSVTAARTRLKAGGCTLRRVSRVRLGPGLSGRIWATSRFPGWLAPVGFGLDVKVGA